MGTLACRGREDQGTPACHTAGWNSPDFDVSGRTFMDILHSGNNQWGNQKKKPNLWMSNILPFFSPVMKPLTLWQFSSEMPTAIKKGGREENGLWLFGECAFTSILSVILKTLFLSLPCGEISAPAQWHWKDSDTRGKPHSGKGPKGKEKDWKLGLVAVHLLPCKSLISTNFEGF